LTGILKNYKDMSYYRIKFQFTWRYFLCLLLFYSICPLHGQLDMNFDNGFSIGSYWKGDIEDFTIHQRGELQLDATHAGESFIFTKFKVPEDSIQAEMYFRMEFSPSDGNRSHIYLLADTSNITHASGYWIRLGKNGSHDAVEIFKLKSGQASFLASGTLGAIAPNPSVARLRFRIYRDGLWLMSADYHGGRIFEEDLELFDGDFIFPDSMYLAVRCEYTSSRTDLFFFDDFSIKKMERDTTPPFVVSADVLDSETIRVMFSEVPEENSVIKAGNYTIDRGVGSPDYVLYSRTQPLQATLVFASGILQSGIGYRMEVTGLKDQFRNTRPHHLDIFYISHPSHGDLKINEVLTDPLSGGEDFVEIVNVSTKFIRMDSLFIRNTQNSQTRAISSEHTLKPGEYIAFSRNISFLKEQYRTPDTARMVAATLPALNVASANITLLSRINGRDVVIDSFDYHQDIHFPLLTSTKGVSLERINPNGHSMDIHNWHSAAESVRFGTPGYKNSNEVNPNFSDEAMIIMKPDRKLITPNSDGSADFLLLEYQLDKPGYLATIQLFDSEGFPITHIVQNSLLSQAGVIKWDGTGMEQRTLPMGLYIIFSRLFHPDGQVLESRHVIVVCQRF
jgi:hypothetical protein